ncbi:prepilin peptidase [Dyella sp. A6]|uniref:A24 family peptidase n=1 Tax=Dyella aluminiiresistens TaxID=3069105 RepID=UPI002E79775A|nr:prepilin peptidase [Dyella sp. A6]
MAHELPLLAACLSVAIIASDLYARRVPNGWLLAALGLGVLMLAISWLRGGTGPWPGLTALTGLVIGLLAMLPLYMFGWMGAGDVKFFAVLGFLLGARALLPVWIIASLLAGMQATAILLSRQRLWPLPGMATAQHRLATSALGRHISKVRKGRNGLPYAAWLGVGALATVAAPALARW